MTSRQIWLNLGGLGALIALLGLTYWLNTGARAVPGLIDDLQNGDLQAQALAAMHLGHWAGSEIGGTGFGGYGCGIVYLVCDDQCG
ncbi:MAG: hypothetical protein ABIP05_13845, partial [Nitrospiraceae bacterium]